MTILEQIAQIVPTLGPNAQRMVLELVTELRDAHGSTDVTLPPADAGNDAWNAWSDRVRARSVVVMAEEKRRLVALGILDEDGNVLTDEVPADMRPASSTSVET